MAAPYSLHVPDPAFCPQCAAGRETFQWLDSRWDVTRAQVLARSYVPTVIAPDDPALAWVGLVFTNPDHLDHLRAPDAPGLITTHTMRLHGPISKAVVRLLIDGHHRLARARRDGYAFTAVTLTEADSWRCLAPPIPPSLVRPASARRRRP